MFLLLRDHIGAWDASVCWVRGEDKSFPSLSKSKIQAPAFRSKTRKAFSYMFGLSEVQYHQRMCLQQQHMNSHCMQRSSPIEAISKDLSCNGNRVGQALFSVSPWQPLSLPSGCHIKEMFLPPLRFNTSLTTAGEVSQPQPRRLENIFPHTSLLKLLNI